MAVNGVGRHEVFLAGLGLDLVAIELCKGTVFLDRAHGARMASFGVKLGRLLNGEGIVVVRRTFATVRGCSPVFVAVRGLIRRYFPRGERSRPFASGRD